MGLRAQAAADVSRILCDSENGAGMTVTLTSPGSVSADVTGFTSDIASLIDPQTGLAVSGRMATAALLMSEIAQMFPGVGLPRGIADSNSKPWTIQFADFSGELHMFKIVTADPDRAVGLLKCTLEAYSAT
jgi:hypothetical protein